MGNGKVAERISAREAVAAAKKYFTDITGYSGNLSVEEVELSDDQARWVITLGYLETPTPDSVVAMAYKSLLVRKAYKRFEVRTDTGEVVAMKIREV